MNMEKKYACIHGHFYQPPRENAWLEFIEVQDGAAPFHDWNEKINFECYAPNTAARILGENQVIEDIVNNYAKISFNIGPTLLSWMEQKDPATYQRILDADKLSQTYFSGHGSAIAQVHSHIIMPLANERDKITQVIWGLHDFEQRFGRKSEGIWLAETAVDTPTLEILVEHGIKYTILAPRQAKAFRKVGDIHWHGIHHEQFDTRRPYWCQLPSGKKIALFFYNGDVSQAVAFEGILNNGHHFAHRIAGALDDSDTPQLVHIATDGESYGHHHRYGEMAMASCLKTIEDEGLATLTNYGEYLEKFPPEYEMQIHENSSWSCVHGVERWRSNCGCNTGGEGHWTQTWRAPLRDALDELREALIPIYEQEAGKFMDDVWAARNAYISVLLDRSPVNVEAFLAEYTNKELSQNDKTQLLRLLEMQRNAILMYTSCGWFFTEVSGIETNQILQYANRAIYYAKQISDIDLHPQFIAKLEQTPSNVHANAADNYRKNVLPSVVGLRRAGMHYAAASLFEKNPEKIDLFNYSGDNEFFERVKAGTQRLVVGRATLTSKVTWSKKQFSYTALYLGQQNLFGSISVDMPMETFEQMRTEILAAFKAANLGQVLVLIDQYFGKQRFSLNNLFKDEKYKILGNIVEQSIQQAEVAFRDVYEDNYQLMTSMKQLNMPLPESYLDATEHILNHDLRAFFTADRLSMRELKRIAAEFEKWELKAKNSPAFSLEMSERIFAEIQQLEETEAGTKRLQNINTTLKTATKLGVEIDLLKSQNSYFALVQVFKKGDANFLDEAWKAAFLELGELLKVRSL